MKYKKKDKIDIPSWFDLNNYAPLKSLDLGSLIEELTIRVDFYANLQEKGTQNSEGEGIYVFPNNSNWKKIISGSPILNNKKSKHNNCRCIHEKGGVKPLTDNDLENYFSVLERHKQGHNYTIKNDSIFDDNFIKKLCDECSSLLDSELEDILSDDMCSKIDMLTNRYGLEEDDKDSLHGEDIEILGDFYIRNHFGTDHENPMPLENFCKEKSLCSICEIVAREDGYLVDNTALPHTCNVCDEYSINVYSSDSAPSDLLISLDIVNNTNDELIRSLTSVLNEARKKFKVPNPKKNKSDKELCFFRGIIEHQVIPFMDLRLSKIYQHSKGSPLLKSISGTPLVFEFSCHVTSKEIPQYPVKSVSNALFGMDKPDTYTGEGGYYKKTVIPRYSCLENIKSAKMFLRKNGYERQHISSIV